MIQFLSSSLCLQVQHLLVLCMYLPTDGTDENLDQKHEASLY